jgi:hypothetical protein
MPEVRYQKTELQRSHNRLTATANAVGSDL